MKREVKIGVFTVLMILGAWASIRFMSGIDLLSQNNDYYAVYDQTNGVQKAATILINGVKVGSVSDVQLSEDQRHVVLKLTLAKKYRLPIDSEAKIFSSNIMSSKDIGINLGSSDQFLNSGDTIRSAQDRDLMAVAGSELEYLKERIDTITLELTRTLSNISTLLESNTANITSTTHHLNQLTEQTTRIVKNNEEQLNQMIEGFSLMSQALGNSAPQIDSIIGNLNSLTAELHNANTGHTIAQTLEELNTLVATLNSEDGSINRLMADGQLYDNLASASGNLDTLLVDFKENPWRYVNISFIGRNEYKMREKMEQKRAKELEKAAK